MGFINVTIKGGGDVGYYGRAGECTMMVWCDEGETSLENLNERWSKIEHDEKFGNKELKIQGRKDAQVRKNYMLTMPNNLTPGECVQRVQKIIQKTDIKNCNYSIFVHRGEKKGVTNQHVHLLVNERSLITMKKNREMQKKEWLEKVFKEEYQREFEKEFEISQKQARRERIPVELYELDPESVRNALKPSNEPNLNFYIEKESDTKWSIYEKGTSWLDGRLPPMFLNPKTGSCCIHVSYLVSKRADEIKGFLKSEEPEVFGRTEEFEAKKLEASLSQKSNLRSQMRR